MTSITCMRTGTALAVKLRREGRPGDRDAAADRVLSQLEAYLRSQNRDGVLEQLQIRCDERGWDLLCIPRPDKRRILDMADKLLDQLSAKGLRPYIMMYRWEA